MRRRRRRVIPRSTEALKEMTLLRLHRLARGWAQWELARQSGVSTRKVSFAERGLRGVLSLADRRRLAAALAVDIRTLFSDVDPGAEDARPAHALADYPHPEASSLPVPRL
jgi:transcriptional regulator with XRE-family HTH domain